MVMAVMESDLVLKGINWKEGVRYLALARGYSWCSTNKVRIVLPARRSQGRVVLIYLFLFLFLF